MKPIWIVSGLLFMCHAFIGCGSTTVNLPLVPKIPDVSVTYSQPASIEFKPPVPMNLSFKEKYGKNVQSQDNVRVRVASITDSINDEDYTIKVEAPDGNTYSYSVFPMMLVLEIENNSDHIIRLSRTIIQIEDENQEQYPLISSFEESKKWLINAIRKSFADYKKNDKPIIDTHQVEEKCITQFRAKVYGSYKMEYSRFSKELEKAQHDPLREGARTPDMEEGYHLTEQGFKAMLERYNPQTVFSNGVIKIRSQIQQELSSINRKIANNEDEIDSLEANAIDRIKKMPTITGIITDGEYLPISILPGRAKRIIAPISKRFPEERIREVNVSIFDIPTKVNAAGDPIKRATFKFYFTAERI